MSGEEAKFCHPSCKSLLPCHVKDCPHIPAASSCPPASGTQLASSGAPESPPCGHCQQPIPDGNGAAGPWGCVCVLGAFKTSCFNRKQPPEQSDDHMGNKTTSLSEEEVQVQRMRCYSCSYFTKSSWYQLKAEAWASPQHQPPLPTPAKVEKPPPTMPPLDTAGGGPASSPPAPAGGFSFSYTHGKHIICQALPYLTPVLSGLGLGLTILLIAGPSL